MFDSLRDKFEKVQEGITASFFGLTVAEPVPDTKTSQISERNLNAGANVLCKYQSDWKELHKIAEENASHAQSLDSGIAELHKNVDKQWNLMMKLSTSLQMLPQLITNSNNLLEEICSLHHLVEDIEISLLSLTDIVEMQLLQENQLESRFRLAMHREKKLADLNNVKARLCTEHADKLYKHEKNIEAKQKERQEVFSQAFQEDIIQYKESGTVEPNKRPLVQGPVLEEIELNEDSDKESLNELLDG